MAAPMTGLVFAPCPPGCEILADLHRHYDREPGVYYQLARPLECCGREWMRPDEVTFLDQCAWCREDEVPLPCVTLIPAYWVIRDKPRRRRR